MVKKALIILLVGIVISYFIPTKSKDFFKAYNVNDTASKTLKEFQARSTKTIEVDGVNWEYFSGGKGAKTILFIHGMGGAYDLWWQQINDFEYEYKVISFSLPEDINSLNSASNGIIKILETEKITKFYVVGTSMGGYIAQYLLKIIPDRIEKIVLGNTFPPNDLILEKNKEKSRIIPFLPEIVISKLGNKQLFEKILPAGNNDKLLTAFLPSLPFSKKQFVNRYAVIVDKFIAKPSKYLVKRIPKLILESANDPLVAQELREDLKNLYSDAKVFNFNNAGHFPYINEAKSYNFQLKQFFDSDNNFVEVEKTIQNYFKGRAVADIDLLGETFSKNAKLYTVINGKERVISLFDYFNKVKKEGEKTVRTRILSGDITKTIANYKTEFKYPSKTYQDYLTLLRTNGKWKIITKTFTKTN